ncbi:MAG: NAD(P)-binding domain-containing protein [Kofleriaceae bacterium]
MSELTERSEKTTFGVLGTGTVGRAVAARLAELGHPVTMGTRDPAATMARREPDGLGNPPFSAWRDSHPSIELGTFAQAAAHGEILVNATSGASSLEALKAAGEANLGAKVLLDLANPLDFSKGMPPSLFVCNTDSLGEQLQRAFPTLRVVKTLNTMNANLMVDPAQLADADHTVFVAGNDAAAKAAVTDVLQRFGWRDVLDLGDLSAARGTEMILPIWLRIWSATKSAKFQLKIVR